MAKHKKNYLVTLFGCLCLSGFLNTGCQTYQQQNKFAPYYNRGDLIHAELEAAKKANSEAKSNDTIIWRLEHATILRAQGKFKESNEAFSKAEERINRYSDAAKVKVASETGALFSNQAQLPYRGRSYDGIMLNTYKALNYLQLGDADNARVELNRAYKRQKDAVEENKKRIEKTEAELAKQEKKDKEAVQKAHDDSKVQSQLESAFANIRDIKAYSDYVNPFTVYLDGIFSMAQGTGAPDFDRARQSFERTLSFAKGNKFVKQDLETALGLTQGQPLSPITYVIFETGRAPERDQVRIDLPVFVAGVRNVPYVGASFPTLKMQSDFMPRLQVCGGGVTEKTELVASLDSVVGQDFNDELPSIITKTIASTTIKAASAYAVNQAARQQSDIGGLFTMLGTAIYQAAVNIADERTWTTLPKEFQVCRIPTPPDRKLVLSGPAGAPKSDVIIADGMVNVVLVKSISATAPLLVSQFTLCARQQQPATPPKKVADNKIGNQQKI